MPQAYRDYEQAESDRQDQRDFKRVLAHEDKMRKQLKGQKLDKFVFKGVMYETLPGIGHERDGSVSGYVYTIVLSALAGYAIAKRDGVTAHDFDRVKSSPNVQGIIDTDEATKVKAIEEWIEKTLGDWTGAIIQSAITMMFFLLKDGPKETFESAEKAGRFFEFDLESAIARMHFDNKKNRDEMIKTVLLLKDDREICRIVK